MADDEAAAAPDAEDVTCAAAVAGLWPRWAAAGYGNNAECASGGGAQGVKRTLVLGCAFCCVCTSGGKEIMPKSLSSSGGGGGGGGGGEGEGEKEGGGGGEKEEGGGGGGGVVVLTEAAATCAVA